MSSIEIVKRSYDAFALKDMAGVMGDMHPEIEWEQAQGLPHGGTYRGLDEVRAVPDEFLDAGDEVVVLGRYRGVGKETGKRLDVPFVHVWTIREEQAVRFRQFLDTAGWVEALKI